MGSLLISWILPAIHGEELHCIVSSVFFYIFLYCYRVVVPKKHWYKFRMGYGGPGWDTGYHKYGVVSQLATVNSRWGRHQKKFFYMIALVLTEQPDVKLSFYQFPFPRYSSTSGFCCKLEIEPFRGPWGKCLCVSLFHPPIVYVYQISELCDQF